MRDRYIDDAEMKTYGDGFIAAARTNAKLSPFLTTLSNAVHAATESVTAESSSTGTIRLAVGGSVTAKRSALDAANQALSQVARVVDAAQKHGVPRKAFFPKGRRTATGKSAKNVSQALSRCISAFDKYKAAIPGASQEKSDLEAVRADLVASMKSAASGRSSESTASPKLVKARAHWHATYKAAKLGTHAVLILTSKDASADAIDKKMRTFFADLSGGKKPRPRKKSATPTGVKTTPPG